MANISIIVTLLSCSLVSVLGSFNCSSKLRFDNKVILLTGASSDLGAGIARYFTDLGGQVVMVFQKDEFEAMNKKKEEIIKHIKGDIKSPISPVIIITSNLLKFEECKEVVEETKKMYGRLDVLVNGHNMVVQTTTIAGGKIEEIEKLYDYNVMVPLLLTNAAYEHWKREKSNGNVVNVLAGLSAYPGIIKAVQEHFTRTFVKHHGKTEIRVNSVHFGEIKKSKEGHTEAIGTVCDIAHASYAVAFIASDLSAYTNGQTIKVDGGHSLHFLDEATFSKLFKSHL